jgi:hypothetical protein|tara:strand:+ start:938 stop:1426 length:489 start_codon:yes stop_codon:yes gene_type:complete
MKKVVLMMIAFTVLVFTSCATILSGTSDEIRFDSDPEGASIMLDGLKLGKTPATVTIKRPGFGNKEITLKLDGYEDRTFMLQKEFNTMAICNLASWPGWVIDILTGSVMKYSKTNYDVDLDAKAFNLNELEKDQLGRYIVPDIYKRSVIVYDEINDLKIHFQ